MLESLFQYSLELVNVEARHSCLHLQIPHRCLQYLNVWGVKPVATHQTWWLESTRLSVYYKPFNYMLRCCDNTSVTGHFHCITGVPMTLAAARRSWDAWLDLKSEPWPHVGTDAP